MRFSCLLILLLIFAGCDEGIHRELPPPVRTSSTEAVKYASHFDISFSGDTALLGISFETNQYLLKVLTDPAPEDGDPWNGGKVVSHAETVATLSTTHVSMLDKAGSVDQLVATAYINEVRNSNAANLIARGEVVELTSSESTDFEQLIALSPDVFFTYPFGDTDFTRFESAGILCVPVCEYLEIHPLGRAEWIKVFGLLTGSYKESCEAFDVIEARYLSLKNLVDGYVDSSENVFYNNFWSDHGIFPSDSSVNRLLRPVVFAGSKSASEWFAPPGNSFVSAFVTDAGGEYLFKDELSEANLQLDFEVLYTRASEAEWWGKVLYEEGEVTADLLRLDDERLSELPCFIRDQIFCCNTAKTDYFGDAVVQPEVILADLIAILHPDILPKHNAVYFWRI